MNAQEKCEQIVQLLNRAMNVAKDARAFAGNGHPSKCLPCIGAASAFALMARELCNEFVDELTKPGDKP